jgi:hypothetical protein
MEVIVRRKPKSGGGSKKDRQYAHNKATGKYVRQKARTTANKKKRIKRQEEIREVKIKNEKLKEAYLND